MYCSSGPNCVRRCAALEYIFRAGIHLLSKYRSVKGWGIHAEVEWCVLRADKKWNRNERSLLFFTECFLWLYHHPCISHLAKLPSSDFVLFPKMSLKHCRRCILQQLKQQQQNPSVIQQLYSGFCLWFLVVDFTSVLIWFIWEDKAVYTYRQRS